MFKLEFETDNAAFDGDDIVTETVRILRAVAERIEDGSERPSIRDINGHIIGRYELTQAPQVELGSTSSDSCRLVDIVDGIADLLPEKLLKEFKAAEPVDPEDDALQMSIFEEICDYLDEIAPEGAHFGTQEGDGACYGFWEDEPAEE